MSPKFIEVCNSAIEWLCDATEGSDQYERGTELREALQDAIASDMLRKRKRKSAGERIQYGS